MWRVTPLPLTFTVTPHLDHYTGFLSGLPASPLLHVSPFLSLLCSVPSQDSTFQRQSQSLCHVHVPKGSTHLSSQLPTLPPSSRSSPATPASLLSRLLARPSSATAPPLVLLELESPRRPAASAAVLPSGLCPMSPYGERLALTWLDGTDPTTTTSLSPPYPALPSPQHLPSPTVS